MKVTTPSLFIILKVDGTLVAITYYISCSQFVQTKQQRVQCPW